MARDGIHRPMGSKRLWSGGRLSSSRQRGQALLFGLLFAAVSAAVVLMMFNASLLTTSKSQLQNAADAGAYSAALLQARDANFSAYTNRAMIANQVAVAQFVSLKSYFDDADEARSRINGIIESEYRNFIPASAPMWDAAKSVPVNTAKSAIDNMAGPVVKALDLLIAALDEAQQIYHAGTMADMMFVADEVVKRNDPQAKVTTSAFMLGDALVRVKAWGNDSTKRFVANDNSAEADRFADAVVDKDSTDWFIRNRFSELNAFWVSTVPLCFGAVSTFTSNNFNHSGATLLSSNKKRWLALDATMGTGVAICTWLVPCWTGLCPVTVTVPLPDLSLSGLGGSGGAVAGAGGGYGGIGEWQGYKNNPFISYGFGGAVINPLTAVPAEVRFWVTGPGATLDSNGGIQDHYRDVADPTNAALKPKDQTPEQNGGKYPVTIEVERTADTLRDTTKFMAGSKQLDIAGQPKGDTLRALSSAHAYFYRPVGSRINQFTRGDWARSDGATEYQNLFSPYWQARLTATTLAEESASALGQ